MRFISFGKMGVIFLLLGLFLIKSLAAQNKVFKPMNIGDSLPALSLHISNPSSSLSSEIKTLELKGKITIFAFWTTWCIPCIREFPLLDSLQKVYKDKIQIILVNPDQSETKQFVDGFFKNEKSVKQTDLPSILCDSVLIKLFPSTASGLHVWVDKNGVFRYRYYGSITSSDLAAMIANNKIDKQNEMIADLEKYPIYKRPFALAELYELQNPQSGFFGSYLTSYVGDLLGHYSAGEIYLRTRGDSVNKIVLPNYSILELFKVAFNEAFHGEYGKYNFLRRTRRPINEIVLNVKNPESYNWPGSEQSYNSWKQKNLYCYQLFAPANFSGNLFGHMREDLIKYFHLKGKIEKRKVKSLVLVKKKWVKGKFPFGSKKESEIPSSINKVEVSAYNYRFEDFSRQIGGFIFDGLPTPFIDGSGINAKQYLNFSEVNNFFDKLRRETLPVQINNTAINLNKIKKALIQYGLDIIEKDWPQDVLVIDEVKEKEDNL